MKRVEVIEQDKQNYPKLLEGLINQQGVVEYTITPTPASDCTQIRTIIVLTIDEAKIKKLAKEKEKLEAKEAAEKLEAERIAQEEAKDASVEAGEEEASEETITG